MRPAVNPNGGGEDNPSPFAISLVEYALCVASAALWLAIANGVLA